MPQFDFSYYPSQVFWLVCTFGFLFLVLSKVALPRVASFMAERQDRIASDIDMADSLSLKAQELSVCYETELEHARQEAFHLMAKLEDAMEQKIEATLASARAENEALIKQAEADIAQHIQQLNMPALADKMAENIIRRLTQ